MTQIEEERKLQEKVTVAQPFASVCVNDDNVYSNCYLATEIHIEHG